MAKNMVQFQKGMSIPEFMDNYGTEQQCRDTLFKLRWPNGFVCPRCDNKTYCEIKKKRRLQCNRCRHQTSLIAGTIFQSTHLPLRKWFLTIFLLTQSKNGISALELCRQLGVSYNAAWLTKHKLMQVMLENNDSDGLQCFDAVVEAKCIHEIHIVGGGKKAAEHPSFKWVNTIS